MNRDINKELYDEAEQYFTDSDLRGLRKQLKARDFEQALYIVNSVIEDLEEQCKKVQNIDEFIPTEELNNIYTYQTKLTEYAEANAIEYSDSIDLMPDDEREDYDY